jgi:hypothetical protein
MNSPLGLKNRLCSSCCALAPHRTVYARATVGGKRRWLTVFWACTKCKSLNHVIVRAYSLARPRPGLPSASQGAVVRALERGTLDLNQLLADLRRNKTPGTSHVFKSEVTTAVGYLKANGVVAEAPRDATERAFESMRGRRHGSCPKDAQRTLVSLYVQKQSPIHGARFVPAGVFCLSCGYQHLAW